MISLRMVPTLQKLFKFYSDIFGCHEVLWATVGIQWMIARKAQCPENTWLFKCCPYVNRKKRGGKQKNNKKINKGNGQPIGKHQWLLQRFTVVKDTVFTYKQIMVQGK